MHLSSSASILVLSASFGALAVPIHRSILNTDACGNPLPDIPGLELPPRSLIDRGLPGSCGYGLAIPMKRTDPTVNGRSITSYDDNGNPIRPDNPNLDERSEGAANNAAKHKIALEHEGYKTNPSINSRMYVEFGPDGNPLVPYNTGLSIAYRGELSE